MNPAQRTAPRKHVFDHGSECAKLCAVANNTHIRNRGLRQLQRPSQQRASVEHHEGLVLAHARALAPSENERGHVTRRAFHGPMIHAQACTPSRAKSLSTM